MVWTVVGLIIFVIVVVVYAGGCGSGMHLSAFVRVFNEGGIFCYGRVSVLEVSFLV